MATSLSARFGIATLSLGTHAHHSLPTRLRAASVAGFKFIDLFDEDWAAHLEAEGLDPKSLWEPTADNLRVARQLGDLIKGLGMQIACTQPLRDIEGILDPEERRRSLELVTKRFPFMRAWDTDLAFMCACTRRDGGVTSDLEIVSRDLAELGDLAAEYSRKDGGKMIKVGYEGLSWAKRNTWKSTWEVVKKVDRENVGLIVDSFNVLAVEWADPYNPARHGRRFNSLDESVRFVSESMKELVETVPGRKIFFFQLGDAELVDPNVFLPPDDPEVPKLLPWSRGHRLFPMEQDKGGYMPVEMVTTAVLATGYQGPLSLEVFNTSLSSSDDSVPREHAERGYSGLQRLAEVVQQVPRAWEQQKPFDRNGVSVKGGLQ